jgi:hypothetical protein
VTGRYGYGHDLAVRVAGGFLVAAGVVATFGCGTGNAVMRSAASPAQALRTCVDRWNQDKMVSWGRCR